MPDVNALWETLDAVKESARTGHFNQESWFRPIIRAGQWCGTSGCFAGHRAFLDGYTSLAVTEETDGFAEVQLENPTTGAVLRYDDMRQWANERFGIDSLTGDRLYDTTNTIADLTECVTWISLGFTEDDLIAQVGSPCSDLLYDLPVS